MTDAFICDAVRTPIGRYAGALKDVRPDDLAAIPIRALKERNPDVDWSALDDVSLLCGVVDVHVALTEPRAYKPPLEDEEAFALMRDGRPGTALESSFVDRYRQIVLDSR